MAAATCPHCGIVILATSPRWMAEHIAQFHPVHELAAIAQDLATGHKWRTALTVADAEFLHQLEIDPT